MPRAKRQKPNRLLLRTSTNHPSETRSWQVARAAERDMEMLRQAVSRVGKGWYKEASTADAAPHLAEFSSKSPAQIVSFMQRMNGERWSSARKAALVQVAREKAFAP